MKDQTDKKTKKVLQDNTVEQFTEQEIAWFKEYNENITILDPKYSTLKPRGRNILVRVYVKDFAKKSKGFIVYSKTEFLPIQSGAGMEIIYDEFPNPYPFTKKAVIVASEVMGLDQGEVICMDMKPVVGMGKQDSGVVRIQGSFVHPEEEDGYHDYPQNPSDVNYGYLLINESQIKLKF